ncbi:hypothetical protein EXIGLDRAFT_57557 [Exidia glandulosa HHB12029]|uniref:Uncharacterized protein n=1 Tax=Exidia glandulosa HHB12029 TaxID=1314781 RepID=A0A166MMR6_EXIGL|nr:hypothetical protein EXIGLDRAFT_57557 [Exidia glandulosa HHB12029]
MGDGGGNVLTEESPGRRRELQVADRDSTRGYDTRRGRGGNILTEESPGRGRELQVDVSTRGGYACAPALPAKRVSSVQGCRIRSRIATPHLQAFEDCKYTLPRRPECTYHLYVEDVLDLDLQWYERARALWAW